MNQQNKTERWVEEFDKEIQKIREEIEEQRLELVEMNDCDGNVCECETGYDVAETYKCKHCAWIVFNDSNLKNFISQLLSDARREERENNKVTGDTSDGYHTFNELYDFRKVFNACLFNEWYAQGKYEVHKSTRHSDGEECFGGGWFIVMATLPTGQISNHYEMKDWGLFDCQVRQRADKWDGHTAKDVLDRLQALTTVEESIKKLK